MVRVKQVGGDHYEAEVQHWDLIEMYDVAYLEATATKYVVRWRKKGGVEDLGKAVSYLEKMGGRGARRLVPGKDIATFCRINELDLAEAKIVYDILSVGKPASIAGAIVALHSLIQRES